MLALIGVSSATIRADILVRQSANGFGYGTTNWTAMTSILDASSGNTMGVVSDFSNTAQIMGADALWVDIGGQTAVLNSDEVLNIQNFAATGKRIVLLGENWLWGDWNNQITGLFGGSYGNNDFDGGTHPAVIHELTSGITAIDVPTGGDPLGGTPLFIQGYAALYGSSENALVLLDVNTFSDGYIGSLDNMVFAQNVADWIAVPEPGSIGLLGLGSGILLFTRRHRRKRLLQRPIKNKYCNCDVFDSPALKEAAAPQYGLVDLLNSCDHVMGRTKQKSLACFDAFLALIMK